MGLAERFKKTLSSTDLFTNYDDKTAASSINSPISIVAQKTSSIPKIELRPKQENPFMTMTVEAVEKVKKTPFWEEYSIKSQEKMLSKYFDTKIKREQYKGIKYSLTDKLAFIEDVLKEVKSV